MHPSSLVFVVVIGIWAAYVTQHWVRRRDHLVTARSVDRFSDAMRLLETRPTVPAVPATSAPRSYVGSPTRATRVTRDEAPEGPAHPDAEVSRDPREHWEPREPVATAPSRSRRPEPSRRTQGARRNPAAGLSFLVAFAATLVTAGLAVSGVLPVWVPLVGVAASAASLLWVRRNVAARQRARSLRTGHRPHARPARPAAPRRATHDTTRPGERGRTRPAGRPDAEPRTGHAAATGPAGPGGGHEDRDVDDTRVATPETTEAPGAPEQGPVRADDPAARADPDTVVFDVEAGAPTAELPAVRPSGRAASRAPRPRPQLDEDDMPLTWDPVPVPRPTYTMKARAYRPAPVQQPAPVPATEPTAPSQDADRSDRLPTQARRAVGG